MEEILFVVMPGMVVSVPTSILVAFLIMMYGIATVQDGFVNAKLQFLPVYLRVPGHRLVAVTVLIILLGVSPWLMADYFLTGMMLFVTSFLILGVIRGLALFSSIEMRSNEISAREVVHARSIL